MQQYLQIHRLLAGCNPALTSTLLQDYYDYMLSYSPVDNIKATAYPNMLVLAGLHDPRSALLTPCISVIAAVHG